MKVRSRKVRVQIAALRPQPRMREYLRSVRNSLHRMAAASDVTRHATSRRSGEAGAYSR
jgi:hypothetical protein